jgi:glucokinase
VAVADAPLVVIGPGTGLGVSGLLPEPGGQFVAIEHAAVLPLAAADIVDRARQGTDAACVKGLRVFCALLGSVAGNLDLTLGATRRVATRDRPSSS